MVAIGNNMEQKETLNEEQIPFVIITNIIEIDTNKVNNGK